MKKILKQQRGVTLISLTAVVIVMGIITTLLLYNISDKRDTENLTKLYSDIDNLSDKVSSYYLTYNKIPTKDVEGLNDIISTTLDGNIDGPKGANDTGEFKVLDLSAMDGLTLNYGRDYEKVKDKSTINNDETDLYVINEDSHNIFYLKGIRVEDRTYYTNNEKDTEEVVLDSANKPNVASLTGGLNIKSINNTNEISGIKIIEGYSYVSGNIEDGIIISNGTDKYMWIDVENSKYEVIMENGNNCKVRYKEEVGKPDATIRFGESQNFEEFKKSVEQNGGFYLKQNDEGKVLYIPVEKEKWSSTYEVESIYEDENGDKAYIPKGFQVSELPGQNTISKGLLIKNAQSGNKYVWIDIPDDVLKKANRVEDIAKSLKEYVKDYQKEGYTDTWYNGCGINTSDEYNQMLEKMYKSLKEKGGFWISADEIGNNVTCLDVLNVNNKMEKVEGKTTSLLFGIQWDLACKFIKENGSDDAKTLNILNFAKDKEEWTLENTTENNNVGDSSLNKSVARGGNGKEKQERVLYPCSTKKSNIAYRVTFY